MKTKKRLLSFLSCVIMLATSVTGVFAAEDTSAEGKHYESTIKYSDIDGTEVAVSPLLSYKDSSTLTIDFCEDTHKHSKYASQLKYIPAFEDTPATGDEGSTDWFSQGILTMLWTNEARGNNVHVAFEHNGKYYTQYLEEATAPQSCEYNLQAALYARKLVEIFTGETNPIDTGVWYDEATLESYIRQMNLVFFKDNTFSTPIETISLSDVIDSDYTDSAACKQTLDIFYDSNHNLIIRDFEVIGLSNVSYKGKVEGDTGIFTDTIDIDGKTFYITSVEGQRTVYCIPAILLEEIDYLYLNKTFGFDGPELVFSIKVTDVSDLENKENPSDPIDVKTVTVTPTISVTDMPADGTMKEGFDITFKSDVPVVLSTQDAPDVSVCSITNKQADGSYTGVYHVDAIGNKDIKFNVNPTVASELSEDGLTKTVYNSTVYTLSIKAFDPGVSTPDIDAEDTVPEDEVIVEIPEEIDPVDPSDPNGPDKVPQTGDTTPIIPLMITMLVSLTVVIFCIVHRKKAKTLLSVVLVVAMLGGILTGIQMNPTEAQAADLSSDTQGSTQGYPAPAGKPSTYVPLEIGYLFMVVPNSVVDNYTDKGWTSTTIKNSDIKNWVFTAYEGTTGRIRITIGDGGNTFYAPPVKKIETIVNNLYDNAPTAIKNQKPSVSNSTRITAWSNTPKDYYQALKMNQILNPFYSLTDRAAKARIVNALFDVSSYTESNIDSYKLICLPMCIGRENTSNFNGWNAYSPAWSYYSASNVWENSGRGSWGVPMNKHCWKFTSCIGTHSALYISDTDAISLDKQTKYNELNEANEPIYLYRGLGAVFDAKSVPVITYDRRPYSDIAYSSYINFALDNKNTTVKYTNDNTNYGGYSGWNFANSDSYITFKHDYRIDKTFTDGVLTSTNYVDLGYTKSGSLGNTASGTKVTGNSVFNGQGYAVASVPSAAGVYAYPYISYKWVSAASGGIGSVWSLDIGTHPGVAYGASNYFLSVANYKSYAGTIPTLDTIKSYLSKNANESGVNRFSNSGYVKFRADFSSPTMYNFLSIDNSVKTNLASQNENRDSVIFTATYTPVNITSNIKLVEVVQDGNTLKVKSVTNGASTSYVNTSTGSLTTPAGYTYYKAVAAGGTEVKAGDVVTSTGLTTCNKTTLKVGSSAIDKGYTIYCYKLPDTWKTDSTVATYVGEDYVNNVDFTYTSYASGSWKYNGAPTVTGNLTSINSYWIAKANSILGGNVSGATSDNVNRLAHQRTFMLNVNRNAYQTLNLSPFVSNSAANANKNGLAGVSAQQSTNKVNNTMDSGAAAYYNNYYTVSGRKVFQPLSSLTNQVNTWKGSTDSFTVNGFTFSKAEVTYKNTTYVGVYNAPSIGTQAVTNNTLTDNGKVYTEVSNTGTKLEFVPHYNMKVVAFGDGSEPYAYSSRHYYNVSVMSNFKRSFNSAMLSGYTFTTGAVSGTTSSDYVDNNGDTLKGSDVTLKVTNPTLSLNTFAYVVDIYGDGDSTELINGYNPASQWGINKYSELLGKVNTKFSNYLTTVQNNLEYLVVLDNEDTKYKDFTVSTSKANPSTSVTADTQTFVLTIKNGVIANDTAYQSMIASIKADFGLASTTEAETLFNNSGIKNMIVNSMHTSTASNNTSTGKWYDEQVNTICIRRFAKTGIQLITNAVVQDKIDYNSEKGDGEWTFIVKNGSATILETEIDGADFEISDKTTQSN